MKVAFISQPFDYIAPAFQSSSIGIWMDQVMRCLEDRVGEFRVYAKHFAGQPITEQAGNVTYRRFSTQTDEWVAKPFKLIERSLHYPQPRRPFFSSPWNYTRFAAAVAQDLHLYQPDIIHIQNYSQFIAPIRALNPRSKIILHMHCEWLTQLDPAIIAPHLEQADVIAGCSDFITQGIQQAFPQFASRCYPLYNGVDARQFQPISHSAAQPDSQTILFVGRISPEKGIHTLLDAFVRIADRLPQATLQLVGAPGDAPYEYIVLLSRDLKVQALRRYYHGISYRGDYFASLKAALPPSLADRVHFTGYVPHADLIPHYQAADVLVNPSLSESFGMSLIEGMSCGVPVIAAQTGGMTEVIREGETGLSVPADNPQSLADALFSLLSDAPRRMRMGQMGRKRVEDHYSWTQVSTSLWNLYQQPVTNATAG